MRVFRNFSILLNIYVLACFNCYGVDKAFEDKRVAITKAFRKAFDVSLPNEFQPLTGGLSSPGIYKVVINKTPYVLRLSHPKRKLGDEQRTMSCIRLGADTGLSPKIYYTSAEDGIIIMDYIKQKLLNWEELTHSNHLKALAATLRKLHAGPKFPEFVTVFEVRRSFERMLGEDRPEFLEELSVSLDKIESSLKEFKIDECPCHHDLRFDNLLLDGEKFWIVDWEAAAQGNFLFDIATVIIFMAITATQEDLFLETYFGQSPTDVQRLQLELMKQFVLSYYGTAYLMVAKTRYQLSPARQDISTLPDAQLFLRNHIRNSSSSISPQNIQEFGLVLLYQAFKNARARH
ncbi:MAG: hypothetical protein FJX03_02995 [Alphaproteobacteria bacterium]|nr:hypothetical protein [Alphaproteobacteria bacterium]